MMSALLKSRNWHHIIHVSIECACWFGCPRWGCFIGGKNAGAIYVCAGCACADAGGVRPVRKHIDMLKHANWRGASLIRSAPTLYDDVGDVTYVAVCGPTGEPVFCHADANVVRHFVEVSPTLQYNRNHVIIARTTMVPRVDRAGSEARVLEPVSPATHASKVVLGDVLHDYSIVQNGSGRISITAAVDDTDRVCA